MGNPKVSTDPIQAEIDRLLAGCRTCGKDASGCVYCQACADKMPEYDYCLDDKNFDAARENYRK